MKKLFVCLMAICLGLSFNASAQSKTLAKQKAKQEKKEYKQKVKKYQKEGWEIFGSSHTLEMALLNHYEALENEGIVELTSYATSTNKNIGKEKLMMAACAEYAKSIGSNIKGRITEDMASDLSTEELSEFENFYAAYENRVKAEVRGELKPSYFIYRPVTVQGKNAYEFEAHFLVDEAGASRARIRAFQNAAKESEIAQKYADKVSKFIEEAEFVEE
jgi:hypothetical protein